MKSLSHTHTKNSRGATTFTKSVVCFTKVFKVTCPLAKRCLVGCRFWAKPNPSGCRAQEGRGCSAEVLLGLGETPALPLREAKPRRSIPPRRGGMRSSWRGKALHPLRGLGFAQKQKLFLALPIPAGEGCEASRVGWAKP
jgi:hypothetical protein